MAQNRSGALRSLFRSKTTERIIDFVLVPVLLFYSLWLPPMSAGTRLFGADDTRVTPDKGGLVAGPYGASLQVPAGAIAKSSRFRLEALGAKDMGATQVGNPGLFMSSASGLIDIEPDDPEAAALQTIPSDLVVYGPFYRLSSSKELPAEAELTVPVPYELAAIETGDLYGWNGQSWEWLPAEIIDDGLNMRSNLQGMPSLIVVAQSTSDLARVGASYHANTEQIQSDWPVSMVAIKGSTLATDGGLAVGVGAASESPVTASEMLLHISNIVDGVVRSDLVDNLIISPDQVSAHVDEIAAAAAGGNYTGVVLAYEQVDPALKNEFSAFVRELADVLHASSRTLAVAVDQAVPGNSWDTGAFDWYALGQVADQVRIPALTDPAAYAIDGDMDDMLMFATSQVDRRKLDLLVSTEASVEGPDGVQSLPYDQALALLAQDMVTDDADSMLLPGEHVSFTLPELHEMALAFDGDAQVYSFDGNGTKIVLENAASVARKLQYATRYGLGGIALDEGLDGRSDSEIAQVIANYQDNKAAPMNEFAMVWTIADENGATIDTQVLPLTNPNWEWTAPNNPGNYTIKASLSDDGGLTDVGPAAEVGIEVPTPTFTPTATPTNTPTATPVPTDTPTPAPTATPKPAPKVAAAPKVGGYFGYGVQAHMFDQDLGRIFDHVNGMGFNWIKQQVEWHRFNPAPNQYDWGALDQIVDAANARGVNVMFSVVKAPAWARPPGDTDEGPPADPNTYGTFMRELAARYKGRVKAYEIWNEQNLYYEWGGRGHKLNAGNYVTLLKAAYNAVKSVDPGAVVISGALTPTGVNDGDTAIDDRAYLEQMYQAGLARYCDAVGAHPSGYNNPPDADWRSWSDVSAPSFKGHPSFFFRGTMESYRNIMVKYGDGNKRVWPTEFGWATVEGLGVGPAAGYGYAADNSEAEQAQYLVRAYQMGKSWGWVGPMFLWNLNFAPVAGNQDEKAAFGIVRHDWGPRPAFSGLRDMPK